MNKKKRELFFPKNRQASHVGVVLSFVLFVVFLTFLYSIVEPATRIQKDKQNVLDSLEKKLIEKFSAEVTSTTISIDKDLSLPQLCIKLENFGNEEIGTRVAIKDSMGIAQGSSVSEGSEGDLQITRGDTGNYFFKIYNSSEFAELETKTACFNVVDTKYRRGLTKTKKYIFENKVSELIDGDYNYEVLKDELNVPQEIEFFFSFEDNGEEVIEPEEKIPQSVNVYAKRIPVHYIDGEANILQGFITIKVW